MANRNFARGSMPPADSYEWCGVEDPPAEARATKVVRDPPKKPGRVWPAFLAIGAVFGLLHLTDKE